MRTRFWVRKPTDLPRGHTHSSNISSLWVAMATSHPIDVVSPAKFSLSHDARTRSRVPSEFKAQHNILLEPTLSTTSSFPHTPQPDTHRSRTWKGACSEHTRFNTNRKDNSTSVNSEHNATMEHYCSAAAVRSHPLAYRPPHTDTEQPELSHQVRPLSRRVRFERRPGPAASGSRLHCVPSRLRYVSSRIRCVPFGAHPVRRSRGASPWFGGSHRGGGDDWGDYRHRRVRRACGRLAGAR